MKNQRAAFVILWSGLSLLAAAQAQTIHPDPTKNEVGLVIGATLTPEIGFARGGSVSFDPSLALGAEYDRRLFGRRTTLDAGIDLLASPLDVKASNPPADVSRQYAYLFLTPHARVHFNAEGTLRPWLLFGGGFADFTPARPFTGTNVSDGNKSGTFEFGGGIDTKPLIVLPSLPVLGKLPVGARFEVRDFYSGKPNYGAVTSSGLQNNIALTGGLVLHF